MNVTDALKGARLSRDERLWTAHNPLVPGAYGLGGTRARALADLAEALRLLFGYEAELARL